MMSKPCHLHRFRAPGLLAVGFIIGVFINQLGFVMERIRVRVELVKSDKSYSPHAVYQELMQKLPHLSQSSTPSFVVPNIVHYFWSVSLVCYNILISEKHCWR